MIENGEIEDILQELWMVKELFDWYTLVAARHQKDIVPELPIVD